MIHHLYTCNFYYSILSWNRLQGSCVGIHRGPTVEWVNPERGPNLIPYWPDNIDGALSFLSPQKLKIMWDAFFSVVINFWAFPIFPFLLSTSKVPIRYKVFGLWISQVPARCFRSLGKVVLASGKSSSGIHETGLIMNIHSHNKWLS